MGISVIARNCRKLIKEKETRKCYKCNKVKYLAKKTTE